MTEPKLDEHHRRLEAMYAGAPINRSIPSRVVVGHGTAEVQIDVGEDYWHAAHALHGSVYFKALDDAAFFAANSVVLGAFVLTARFEVELLAPVTSQHLRAVGKLERRDGKKLEASASLQVEDQEVARGRGLFVVGPIALEDVEAYRTALGDGG